MYILSLSHNECKDLVWAADRGYFPEELATFLSGKMAEIWDQHHAMPTSTRYHMLMNEQHCIEIPEHVVWSLMDLREENPDAYLACIGGDLLVKITSLEMAIV